LFLVDVCFGKEKRMFRLFMVLLSTVILAGCAASALSVPADGATDPGAVLDRTWQWKSTQTSAEKIVPKTPERYTIRLTGEGRLQARFDCNSGGGSYQISTGKLSFGPMLSTRMACSPDSLDTQFMRDLGSVDSFSVEGAQLSLRLKGDGGSMHFRPQP
jgi:heat shock protein HslJ